MPNLSEIVRIFTGEQEEEESSLPPFNKLAKDIHTTSKSKGFYYDMEAYEESSYIAQGRIKQLVINEKLLLVVTEVAEIVQEMRDNVVDKEAQADEFADVIVRLLDVAEFSGIDIEGALTRVLSRNKNRPHMHNKRF